MQFASKRWFTEEAKRAGWIAAGACVIVTSACISLARGARGPQPVLFFYSLLPVTLGCVAVGALNFRRWHSFAESLAACFQAVLDVYKILGTLAAVGLLFTLIYPLAFLYLLILLIYGSLYLAFYISVSFLIVLLAAWVAGAALYGLLWLMRFAGELGRKEPQAKDESPRVLRMVV